MLKRALEVESDIKGSESERKNRKRSRLIETKDDQHENQENNSKKKKGAESCKHCSKNHGRLCLKKLGACYQCGRGGHLTWKCPNKKTNDSKTISLIE